MRSGNNWVGTDWYTNQSQTFHFSADKVSGKRKVKITWWITTECNDAARSPTYYVCYGSQKLVVNGSTIVNWSGSSYTSDGHTVYRAFVDKGSWLDVHYSGKVYHDLNGDYIGINRYVKCLGAKWESGSFILDADDDGAVRFSVSGKFGWYGKTGLNFSKEFVVKSLVPVKYYAIKYEPNLTQSTVTNLPIKQEKKKDKDIKLSDKVPVSTTKTGEINYIFKNWETSVTNSVSAKSGSKSYKPSATYSANKDLTLYALWETAYKTISYDLSGGSWDTGFTPTTKVKYNGTFRLPAQVTKDGYVLTQWYSKKYKQYFSVGSIYTASYDDTLVAQYVASKYTITLKDVSGNVLRTIPNVVYNSSVFGDFTYSVSGYTCLGWSTNPSTSGTGTIYVDYSSSNIPICPNDINNVPKPYNIYMGQSKYTSSNQFEISSGVYRKHIFSENITLYPILRYETSMYVYTNGAWKLATPYVYTNGTWKLATGHLYRNGNWTRG